MHIARSISFSFLIATMCSLNWCTNEISQESKLEIQRRGENFEFVIDVISCLRLVRDTKESSNPDSLIGGTLTERQRQFYFVQVLRKNGSAIQSKIARWRHSRNETIKEAADHLFTAGQDLIDISQAQDNLLKRIGDSDEQSAIFRARQYDLDTMMFAGGALAAHSDPKKRLPLSPTEKEHVINLIEKQLFKEEMKEYDESTQYIKQTYITVPDLFAVLAFRNVYKRDIDSEKKKLP